MRKHFLYPIPLCGFAAHYLNKLFYGNGAVNIVGQNIGDIFIEPAFIPACQYFIEHRVLRKSRESVINNRLPFGDISVGI